MPQAVIPVPTVYIQTDILGGEINLSLVVVVGLERSWLKDDINRVHFNLTLFLLSLDRHVLRLINLLLLRSGTPTGKTLKCPFHYGSGQLLNWE